MIKKTLRPKASKKPAAGKKFSILISNDDGIQGPGLQALARALTKVGDITVVAPEREQSTMGHALTLHKPVRLFNIKKEKGMEQYALSGTPADCVYMGIRYVLKKYPDLIVSGINNGVNVGNDIYYSGTVAAAREGAVLNIPAIAVSLDYHHVPGTKPSPMFDDCADYMVGLVRETLARGLPSHGMLNVNFPNLPFKKIKGTVVSRQGFRMYTDSVSVKYDSRGKGYYWLGGKYAGFKPIPGSDCEVLDKGYISVTPCRLDITQYDFLESLGEWNLAHGKLKKR